MIIQGQKYTYLRLLTILMVITYLIGASLFYVLLVLSTVEMYKEFRSIKFYSLMTIYLIVALASIIVNQVVSVSAWGRFASFSCIMITYGPVCTNSLIDKKRKSVLYTLLYSFATITLISILLMILGVVPRVNPNETSGGFSGILNSSMTLAPIVASSAFLGIYILVTSNKYKYLKILFILICIWVLFITGSRSAIAAFFIALAIFLWGLYQKRILTLLFLVILPLICVAGLSAKFVDNIDLSNVSMFEVILKKHQIEETLQQNSRETKWTERISEFQSNPFLGVGLFSVDENYSRDDISSFRSIEYGTSWLALLSTTGIIGFLFIFIFYIKTIFSLWKKRILDKNSLIILALVIFFGLHLIFEGYMFSARNILTVFFWCLMSYAYSYNKL